MKTIGNYYHAMVFVLSIYCVGQSQDKFNQYILLRTPVELGYQIEFNRRIEIGIIFKANEEFTINYENKSLVFSNEDLFSVLPVFIGYKFYPFRLILEPMVEIGIKTIGPNLLIKKEFIINNKFSIIPFVSLMSGYYYFRNNNANLKFNPDINVSFNFKLGKSENKMP
jgi:hypothetical protein